MDLLPIMDQTLKALMDELHNVLQRERFLRKTAEELVFALQKNHAGLVTEVLHLRLRVRELEKASSSCMPEPETGMLPSERHA